ncbi:MAG TPA: hypothetical protein VHD15_07305 [Hyphomicrobiales bacterium]|nr:hypothetical protein [Hyphomicrobiales bacterium]
MEFVRMSQGIYGQSTIVGAAWDVLPWFAVLGAAIIVLHILAVDVIGRRKRGAAPE